MKALARNKQSFFYALPLGLVDELDEDGLYTGNQIPSYTEPEELRMNISPASGRTVLEWFGVNEQYDKVLVTDDADCPITELAILWIDAEPTAPHDYLVTRVSRSLNSTVIGLRKVSVSEANNA